MALSRLGSLGSRYRGSPSNSHFPPATRLGQGTNTAPAPIGGRSSSAGKVSRYGTPSDSKARRPAPSSVITARNVPDVISYCAPVMGAGYELANAVMKVTSFVVMPGLSGTAASTTSTVLLLVSFFAANASSTSEWV